MEKELTRQEQEEAFLKVYNETGVQKRAADAVGWTVSKAWRFIEKLRKNQPELLKTPQAPQKPHTSPKLSQPKESTLKEEKTENKANTKPQKGTMGFRTDTKKIEYWRLYADVTDTELGIMCTSAIDEYVQRHKLTEEQQAIIDIRLKALEAEKRIRQKSN